MKLVDQRAVVIGRAGLGLDLGKVQLGRRQVGALGVVEPDAVGVLEVLALGEHGGVALQQPLVGLGAQLPDVVLDQPLHLLGVGGRVRELAALEGGDDGGHEAVVGAVDEDEVHQAGQLVHKRADGGVVHLFQAEEIKVRTQPRAHEVANLGHLGVGLVEVVVAEHHKGDVVAQLRGVDVQQLLLPIRVVEIDAGEDARSELIQLRALRGGVSRWGARRWLIGWGGRGIDRVIRRGWNVRRGNFIRKRG